MRSREKWEREPRDADTWDTGTSKDIRGQRRIWIDNRNRHSSSPCVADQENKSAEIPRGDIVWARDIQGKREERESREGFQICMSPQTDSCIRNKRNRTNNWKREIYLRYSFCALFSHIYLSGLFTFIWNKLEEMNSPIIKMYHCKW